MATRTTPDCLTLRIARVGYHVDCGEWAAGHAILAGLRACGLLGGCASAASCAAAAELLMGDLRGLLRDTKGAPPPHS